MNALIKKGWADLRVRFWQSALMMLSIGAAATLLYLGLASLFASTSPYEKQMERANGAHAWFALHETADGEAAAARIASRDEVAKSLQRNIAFSHLLAPDSEKVPKVVVIPLAPDPLPMMGYILLEGREAASANEALFSASMARYLRVGTGDVLRLHTANGPHELTVTGLIADPASCTYPRCDPHPLYVLADTFASLAFADDSRTIQLGVKLRDAEQADAFVSRVRTTEVASLKGADSWLTKQDFYRGDQLFNVVPILLLGIVAVVAAAMILANIIGGAVLGQYREIAVLKAIGFSGSQVLLLYVGQTLFLGVMGGALGLAGGHFLAMSTMAPMARSMGTPDVLQFMPDVAGAVLVIVLVVAALFAGLAAWRAVTMRPAMMLAGGFAAPRARISWPVRLVMALRLPAAVLLGVKDATARPARVVMTTLSLTICLITIILGLNFPGIATQIMTNQELIGINWDMTMHLDGLSLAEAEAAVASLPELRGYYREVIHMGTVTGRDFDLVVRAVDGDWDQFGFRLLEGRLPAQPGEILLAPRAWERLGIEEGAQLHLQVRDGSQVVTVVGKYQDQINNGRIALMTQDTFAQMVPQGELPSLVRVKMMPGANWLSARNALLEALDHQPMIFLEDSELPDFALDVVTMMKRLAWVMALIACLSIMGAALLTAREQMREVGIRKAIGMSPAQILGSVASGGAWFGVVAVALALPSGYAMQKGIALVMASVMGLGEIPLALPAHILLLAGALGLVLAVGSALPAAVWGANVVTAQALHTD